MSVALRICVDRAGERVRIEQEVERLIAMLDAMDGDADLEDGDEDGQCDDEGFDCDHEPEADHELPAPPFVLDQTASGTLWAA